MEQDMRDGMVDIFLYLTLEVRPDVSEELMVMCLSYHEE